MRLVALVKVHALVLQAEPLHVGVFANFLQVSLLVDDEVLDLCRIEDELWLHHLNRVIYLDNNWRCLDFHRLRLRRWGFPGRRLLRHDFLR